MGHKSFQTYTPTEVSSFDINGRSFRLNPAVPGDILLDFLAGSNSDNPAEMAKMVRSLMGVAIVAEQQEEWLSFIRDPANNVTLSMLSEIAGYVSEKLSGNPTKPQDQPFMAGSLPTG